MIEFNYYPADIKKAEPLGKISLQYFIDSVRFPKPHIIKIFEQIRIAEQNKDQARKSELKTKLVSFTPCVLIDKIRNYNNILSWTGLMVLDFDHLDSPEYAEEFKQYLFNEYKFIIASWLSASRHGVRAFVNIPICTSTDEFKSYFLGIKEKLFKYKGFDIAPQNCVLPLFYSIDENILHRFDASLFKTKHNPIIKPIVKQYIIQNKTNIIEKIILNKINVIVDNGHPQLRAAAYLLGGYVGARYIDHDYAITMLHRMIECNAYLSQKQSIYKKTAITMINQGIYQPVYLENYE